MRYKEITEVKKIIAAWYSNHMNVYAAYRDMIDKLQFLKIYLACFEALSPMT